MFLFGKKKEKKAAETESVNAGVDQKQKESVLQEAAELEKRLSDNAGQERTELLNKLGTMYFQIEEYDRAIQFYEKSLEEDASLGQAHTELVKLYNIKRREAAKAKDSALVQEYLDKMDKITNLSKDSMRKGRF